MIDPGLLFESFEPQSVVLFFGERAIFESLTYSILSLISINETTYIDKYLFSTKVFRVLLTKENVAEEDEQFGTELGLEEIPWLLHFRHESITKCQLTTNF